MPASWRATIRHSTASFHKKEKLRSTKMSTKWPEPSTSKSKTNKTIHFARRAWVLWTKRTVTTTRVWCTTRTPKMTSRCTSRTHSEQLNKRRSSRISRQTVCSICSRKIMKLARKWALDHHSRQITFNYRALNSKTWMARRRTCSATWWEEDSFKDKTKWTSITCNQSFPSTASTRRRPSKILKWTQL